MVFLGVLSRTGTSERAFRETSEKREMEWFGWVFRNPLTIPEGFSGFGFLQRSLGKGSIMAL